MIVKVIEGFRCRRTKKQLRVYLDWLATSLRSYGLDVKKISSEKLNGTMIILEVSDETDPLTIYGGFLDFATALLKNREDEVVFYLDIEGKLLKVTAKPVRKETDSFIAER